MTPARFQTIEEIFHSARDQGPEQMGPFLDAACAGDAELRAEVELILASHERASSFIELPAIGLADRILQRESAGLLVGQRFGHYELIRHLGAGGMGEVYLATDVTAGRKAALKFLPPRFIGEPKRLKRFDQEARAVVALNHPNIVTVYEIGEDRSTQFIASELIEGRTLRQRIGKGRLGIDEAIDIALQVASALAAADEAGIIHRDIKPENIMLRPDGYVKVLDFGIAKLAEIEPPVAMAAENAPSVLETRVTSLAGTARYMSPEQTLGAAIDRRTDIWSLGVVLYEMLAGRAPFTGENAKEVMTAILQAEPPPLTGCPDELEQIVRKTLRKEPNERHANARELIEALKKVRRRLELTAESEILKTTPAWRHWRRWAAALLLLLFTATLAFRFYWTGVVRPKSPPPIKSIAVLPFDNLSGDQQNAYFAVAVQDEILSDLAKIADLKVISRTSARLYEAGKPRNSGQIGQELGVAHLLEGNVQRTGNHLRINAQLIDTRTDSHLWAQTYDRDVADIFALQSEIAQTIAEQLRAKISERERLAMARPTTTDLIAQDLYTQALLAENELPGPPDLRKAIELLERALARDPRFVLACCALGRVHLTMVSNGEGDVAAHLKSAQSMIEKAGRLQPDAGEVHLLRAHYLGYTTSDYDRARAELELARRALPNNAAVYLETAMIDRRQGRWSEALMNLDRAVELDPRNGPVLVEAASTYYTNRRYAEGTRLLDRAIALAPKDYYARLLRAEGPLFARADTRPLHAELDAILAEDPRAASTIADSLLDCALFERDAAAADRAVAAIPAEGIGFGTGVILPREYFAARVARTFHRPETARAGFEAVRSSLQKLVHEQPDLAEAWSRLGLVEAALGQKEEAIKAGLRAREIMPVSRQAFAGGRMLRELAKIYAWVGEKDQALALLATCARENYSIDSAVLKLDPDWDSLRGDPRFEALIARVAPDASETAAPDVPEKSIAVLPFEDLSDNRESSGFGAGIQEDLLTSLAQIRDLKVISRTSVMAYQKAEGRNIREIGRALGVANVLEGSVRRAGNRVLVNVQLIDARNDRHVWAERYDRTVADSIDLQSELATQIAVALKATLAPEEKARLGVEPTTNSDAYVLYLTALGTEDEIAAERLCVQAAAIDPTFALAYARASRLNSVISSQGEYQKRKTKARAQAEEALRLSPNLSEGHMALGVCFYLADKKYDAALREFEISAAGSPNNAEVYTYIADLYRRQGRWRESLASFDRALSLDPRNAGFAFAAARNYLYLRDWATATNRFRHVLELEPEDVAAKMALAYLEVFRSGDPFTGTKILQGTPTGSEGAEVLARWDLAMMERDYATAANILSEFKDENFFEARECPKTLYQGRTALARGDRASAERYLGVALPALEGSVRDNPDDANRHAGLGLLYAYMGRKDDAIRESRTAIELEPESQNAFHGTYYAANLALVYALVGAQDSAITLIERLLSIPDGALSNSESSPGMALAELRLRWEWDSLRSNPRFQKILAAPEPKTILPASH